VDWGEKNILSSATPNQRWYSRQRVPLTITAPTLAVDHFTRIWPYHFFHQGAALVALQAHRFGKGRVEGCAADAQVGVIIAAGAGPFNGPLMDMGTEPFQAIGGRLSDGFIPQVSVQLLD
jgi:hypothetical protein